MALSKTYRRDSLHGSRLTVASARPSPRTVSPDWQSARLPAACWGFGASPIPLCRFSPNSPVRGSSHSDDGVSVRRHLLIGALVAALMTEAASADTLREALNSTYRSN